MNRVRRRTFLLGLFAVTPLAGRPIGATAQSGAETLGITLPPAQILVNAEKDQRLFPGAPSPFQGWGFGIERAEITARLIRSKAKGTYWEPDGDAWMRVQLRIETLAAPMMQPFPFEQLALEDSQGTLYPVDIRMTERDRANQRNGIGPSFTTWEDDEIYDVYVVFDLNLKHSDQINKKHRYHLRTLDGQISFEFLATVVAVG
jgi:hypothetical protein